MYFFAVPNYPKSEQEITKDGKTLVDFKYACVGYSIYRNHQPSATKTDSELQMHELPFCMGIEV